MGRASMSASRGKRVNPAAKYYELRTLQEAESLSPCQGHMVRVTLLLTLIVAAIFYYWSLLGGAQQMLRWFGEKPSNGNKYRKIILMIFYPFFALRLAITLCVSNMRRKSIWTEFVTVYIIFSAFLSFYAVYGAIKSSQVTYLDYTGIIVFIISNIAAGFYEHVQLKRAQEFSYPLASLIIYHGMLMGWCFVSRAIFMFWWPLIVIAIFLLIVGHGSDRPARCEGCDGKIVGYSAKYKYCKACRNKAKGSLSAINSMLGVDINDVPAGSNPEDLMTRKDVCAKCEKPLNAASNKTGYINAMGRNWHPECFTCMSCDNPFLGKEFYINVEDKQPYCQICSRSFQKVCAGCGNSIPHTEAHIFFAGKAYHMNCMKCTKCGTNIGNGKAAIDQNNNPVCESCH